MEKELGPKLTERAIERSFASDVLRRGIAYALDDRVDQIAWSRRDDSFRADVRGSAGRTYATVTYYDEGAARWWSECSCPMGEDCKHAAAVLISARAAVTAAPSAAVARTPGKPAWELALAGLLEPGTGARGALPVTPMGLQFEIEGSGTPSIRLRPVVPGARGRWVRTGVSWRALEQSAFSDRDPAHAAALQSLHRVHEAGDQGAGSHRGYGYGYGYGSGSTEKPVRLETFGPELWPALRRLLDAGVTFVTRDGHPVRVADEPGALVLDLSSEDGGLLVEPVLELERGVVVPARDVLLLGGPPHGAALRRGTPGVPELDGGGLLLVALTPIPARGQRLVGGAPLRVPAADRERFLDGYLPVVRRALPVRSSDGSVELPEIVPPRLCLRVAHRPGHRAQLAWGVRYRDGDATSTFGAAEPVGRGRDAAAEALLLRELPEAADRLPRLWDAGPPRRLASEIELAGMDVVVLVTAVLPALVEAGVEVEEDGERPDFREAEEAPVVHVSATDRADAGDRGTDWFDLGLTVRVDGQDVPFAALFGALAAGESHLLLPSGTWFDVRRPEFARLRELIAEAQALTDDDGRSGLRITRYQAGLWEELVALGVVDAQSDRWARDVRGLLDVATVTDAPPAGLEAQLRPYQLEGYRWLSVLWDAGLGGVLADDMGLGKTLQTLAMVCRAKERGELTAPVLVVAPTSVVSNWAREAARFAPGLVVATVEATARKRGSLLAEVVAGADVVVTSYTLLRLGELEYGALPWSGLVLDEAQFVKNHQAKTYAAARRLPARFKLAITGTPVENNLMDLWSMLSIVAPGLFPSPQKFTESYRTPIEKGGDPAALATLRRRIRPLMRRRTKEQVAAELPAKTEQLLSVVLDPKHRKVYDTHLQRERTKILGLVEDLAQHRFTIFRSLTLLRQLALDPALVDDAYAGVPSSKADAFVEHLGEVVAEGHRALVFSSFTGFLGTVRRRLDAAGTPYAYLDGSTRNRDAAIAEFRYGGAPVFLISLKSGGFGLNLTEADYVYVLDPWWNPAAEAQAVDRAHRIGQDKNVMVYRLVAADTIEEKVLALQQRKRDLFSRVMDDEAGALAGALTADDIRGLFS